MIQEVAIVNERFVEELPDPEKLELLARWFDDKHPDDANPEVQSDLRRWAKAMRRLLTLLRHGD